MGLWIHEGHVPYVEAVAYGAKPDWEPVVEGFGLSRDGPEDTQACRDVEDGPGAVSEELRQGPQELGVVCD